MCAPSPPPAPDYTGAATAQGAANVDAARAQGHINNPNVVNPYGTQTVTWDDLTPTIHQTLSPAEQSLFDQNMQTQQQLAALGTQGADSLKGVVGTPVDFGGAPQRAVPVQSNQPMPTVQNTPNPLDPNSKSLPAMPQSSAAIRDQVISAMMSRANTDIGHARDQKVSDLTAAGIHPGTEAYAREMDLLNRQQNDAEQQAILGGNTAAAQAYQQDLATRQEGVGEQGQSFGQGLSAGAQTFGQENARDALNAQLQQTYFGQESQNRKDAIAELLAQRETPLNEISALRSGSQVANPFSVPGYAQNSQVAPAPTFGATQAQGQYGTDVYNANVGQHNANTQAAGAIGSAALLAAFF